MSIKKLPNHLINKLKAGEIVERPYSVLKELIENALDAGATVISIDVHDGGSRLIKVSDNGSGISRDDLGLVLERYATSKIATEQDLERIDSYGFRGEALASIAEVSKVTLQTKIENGPIGLELTNITGSIQIESIPFLQPHGTTVIIEDLFYNTPARLKFLKSSQTEYMYLYQLFIDVALMHRDKTWIFKKQGSVVFDLGPARDMSERFGKLFKPQWIEHLKPLNYQSQDVHMSGLIGDSTLSFGSADNIKIYVNDRPVQDRIIKKALLSAYDRQIKPGENPLAIIILNLDPKLVDVNVHPRKSEVRFIDPGGVFQLISHVIRQTLGGSKIIPGSHTFARQTFQSDAVSSHQSPQNSSQPYSGSPQDSYQHHTPGLFAPSDDTIGTISGLTAVGQIRDSYIIATDHESLYYVDQHALAERIGFDQLKQQRKPEGQSSHILLHPEKMTLGRNKDVSTQIEQLNQLSFDIQQLSPETIIITAVPEVFSRHPIELETLFNVLLYQDQISYDIVLDQLRATKSCKAAIKAGDRLSLPQMQQLLDDGMTKIDGMFVCQHGRPFWIQIPRSQIDTMVDR